MNYKESEEILKKINNAKSVLLNCHTSPDPDSIGSALALKRVLEKMGKKVEVVCPSKKLFKNVDYLKGYGDIKTGVDLESYDYSGFDLFIIIDSGNWDVVYGKKGVTPPKIPNVVIDHHITNPSFGDLNLIDPQRSSTAEVLFMLFEDWYIEVDRDISDCLMVGIVGDSGAFGYPDADGATLQIAQQLIDIGADKNKAIRSIYRSDSIELLNFYGEVLKNMKVDKEKKFVWSAVDFETYSRLNTPASAKVSAASMFATIVEGTEFGFIAVEAEQKKLGVSFRSRKGYDVSKIAQKLGGGGHVYAAGAKIEGMEFGPALEKLLSTVRKAVDEKNIK